jgi:hypothetical protein
MGIKCLGLYLGHPAPGGYKYGVLAVPFGGWATGRKHATIKNLTIRPRNTQTEWNRPWQWKWINEMRLETGVQKTELTGRSPLRRRKSALDCSA